MPITSATSAVARGSPAQRRNSSTDSGFGRRGRSGARLAITGLVRLDRVEAGDRDAVDHVARRGVAALLARAAELVVERAGGGERVARRRSVGLERRGGLLARGPR